MATIRGTSGDDVRNGTNFDDLFWLGKGGTDTATGNDGNDVFHMGATFDATDVIDGGADNDTVVLNGGYGDSFTSTFFVLSGVNLQNVETLKLAPGHEYLLSASDDLLGSSQTLTIDGSRATTTLQIDMSGETGGHFHIVGGREGDYLTGGGAGDYIDASKGGVDSVVAGGGDDTIYFGKTFTSVTGSGDGVDGGDGNDTLVLDGSYSFGMQDSLFSVEAIQLTDGHNYLFSFTDDFNVAAGATMTIDASALRSHFFLGFDGSGETDGKFHVIGGAGHDQIVGGQSDDLIEAGNGDDTVFATPGHDTVYGGGGGDELNAGADSSHLFGGAGFDQLYGGGGNDGLYGGVAHDNIVGGGGADRMRGGNGSDTFFYAAASDSTSTTHDRITDFDANHDTLSMGMTVGGFDGTVSWSVSQASFDTDIGTAFSDGITLHGDHAWLVHASGGDLIGHDFLVVDTDNNAHYDGGTDFVIDITGYTGTLDTGDFI